MDLRALVKNKIEELGVKKASKFFGVSSGTVSNWANGKTPPSLDSVERCLAELGASIEIKTDIIEWEGKKVMMLLPVYRTFNADTHFTLFANYAKYGPDKIGMEVVKRTVIHEARNILVNKWYKSGIPTCIMVDDDMILPCGNPALFNGRYGANVGDKSASFNAISRILSHGVDKGIVGALYFGRHDDGVAQCSAGFESERGDADLKSLTNTGLKPMNWVATGFMKIERWVVDKMKDAVDSGKWPECKPSRDDLWYGYFNPLRVGVGEDVSFCRRAADIGITSYLDTELILLHNGERNFGPKNTKKR